MKEALKRILRVLQTAPKTVLILSSMALLSFVFIMMRTGSGEELRYRENTVIRGDIEVTIFATGTVQPQNRLSIKPPITGRADSIVVKEGQYVKKGQTLAWVSSIERAALLDAARSKGPDEVKRWEELYRPISVVAPISGTIILRNLEPGQTFTNEDPILVMSDRLTVKAQVDETDLAQVKLQQSADIILDAYPHKRISSVVEAIAFEAKTVNNVTNYIVDVLPIKTPEHMRAGMTANVTFFVESRKGVLVVPSEALLEQEGSFSVLVRRAGFDRRQEVQIGASDGKRTEILSGLNEGDTVLTAELQLSESGKESSSPFGMPKRSTSRQSSGRNR